MAEQYTNAELAEALEAKSPTGNAVSRMFSGFSRSALMESVAIGAVLGPLIHIGLDAATTAMGFPLGALGGAAASGIVTGAVAAGEHAILHGAHHVVSTGMANAREGYREALAQNQELGLAPGLDAGLTQPLPDPASLTDNIALAGGLGSALPERAMAYQFDHQPAGRSDGRGFAQAEEMRRQRAQSGLSLPGSAR